MFVNLYNKYGSESYKEAKIIIPLITTPISEALAAMSLLPFDIVRNRL